MDKLNAGNDVWVLTPTVEDLRTGAHYAAISLPWTFNRMMLNTGSRGQQNRALNIAKGIVGQEMLKRKMNQVGIRAETQRKSHRAKDLFDFNAEIDGRLTMMDLKTFHHYRDYDASVGREAFSVDLLLKHAGYSGSDWRTFFPMLVPHTQIEQKKEGYVFGIGHSFDIRGDANISTDRIDYALTAFPYGPHLEFFSSQKLCQLREEAQKGFYIELLYTAQSLFGSEVTMTVIGEWDGELTKIRETLCSGVATEVGPFSCISSFQIDLDSYEQISGPISISVKANAFTERVLNTTKRNINLFPEASFALTNSDFCNLFLPTEYRLYVIGWVFKEEFLHACRKYTGWVWPMNSLDRLKNQAWTQITEDDRKKLVAKGFSEAIQSDADVLRAGWLKTTGRGGGACCYVFPNIGAGRGGVRETNLYVLPQDLYNMGSL